MSENWSESANPKCFDCHGTGVSTDDRPGRKCWCTEPDALWRTTRSATSATQEQLDHQLSDESKGLLTQIMKW